ncbi:DUF443 family protein [Virgibacillus halodenitrificans]|uniref:DUF443 family protein n=1 Tax=Virgibacillus halodenitrificans TaxID=1482 RepID=UPI00045CAFB1|nr:DUF443 family protein [Virgibacillus halodenitrificans]MEC2158232.1 DUF443 family protein [Virgibacillus halodenitrificans]CDQ31148.1 tandem five-TM protein [Virgibacillus halodenitrificans]
MDGKIEGVYKNLRYRILSIEDDVYLIDMGHSLWKLLFPFLYWLLPHTAFKIESASIVKNLKSPSVQQKSAGSFSVVGVGVSILLANLITPFISYFDLQTSASLNSLAIALFIILAFVLWTYFSKVNQENLIKIVELKKLKGIKLWVRPKSTKSIIKFLFAYLFMVALIVMGVSLFIIHGNVLVLLFTFFFLGFLFLISALTLPVGVSKIKFMRNKFLG